jgi:hypothetical protein
MASGGTRNVVSRKLPAMASHNAAALEGKILYALAGDLPRSRAMSATFVFDGPYSRHATVPASMIVFSSRPEPYSL